MANLADRIERYLKEHLSRTEILEVRRAMLAALFDCAPSQINYVLTTRFTPERGYLVESRRGGGGYIRIIRLNIKNPEDLQDLIERQIGEAISQNEAMHIIGRLRDEGLIDEREAAIMEAAIRREALGLELPYRDAVRASVLKAMLTAILRF
ncbi:MAG: CtsR family transcriptional regulator [Symbiobacteriaceae bacterium]|uniref:Transcriptional regulator CtsR n=1 Tax=Symbiobacterium thermophilum TaxID=2734 RepID=A0A1Y2T3L0_SYMTR|nr:MAG: transcriptional regulator [Symbiobacterium thermophilum]PZN74240.1 MAG: transcriptional regulator [Bacillota bacterium]